MTVYTTWTDATLDLNKALMGLLSCLQAGHNAWIEIQKNGEQNFPIKIKNPELDNINNWEMSYGVPREEKELEDYPFFNNTSRNLTLNYTACFGTQEAIYLYRNTGKLTKDGMKNGGICYPVKIIDAEEFRKDIDGYKYGYWVCYWTAKKGIPYWIVDEKVENVFVICYNNDPYNLKDAIEKTGKFLLNYSKELK